MKVYGLGRWHLYESPVGDCGEPIVKLPCLWLCTLVAHFRWRMNNALVHNAYHCHGPDADHYFIEPPRRTNRVRRCGRVE